MPTIKCSFSGCESNIITENKLSFFRYPINDRKRCEQWVKNSENYKIREIFGKNLRQLRYRTVCEKHFFTYEIINYKNRKQLISSSVPKILMPGQTSLVHPGASGCATSASVGTVGAQLPTATTKSIGKPEANHHTLSQSVISNISAPNRRLSSDISSGDEDMDDDDMDSHSSEDNFIDKSLKNLEQIERTINSLLSKQSLEAHLSTDGQVGSDNLSISGGERPDMQSSDQSFDGNECQDEDLVEKLLNFEQILTENDGTFASNLSSIQTLISQSLFGHQSGYNPPNANDKQKRKCLTISEKLEIIQDFNDGMKRTDIMRKYCLPYQSSLSAILRNKDKYIEYITKGFGREDKLKRVKSRRGWVVPKATPLPPKVPKTTRRSAHTTRDSDTLSKAHFSGGGGAYRLTHKMGFAGGGAGTSTHGYKPALKRGSNARAERKSVNPVGRPKGSTKAALNLAKNRVNSVDRVVAKNVMKNIATNVVNNNQNLDTKAEEFVAKYVDLIVDKGPAGVGSSCVPPPDCDAKCEPLLDRLSSVAHNVLNSNNCVVNNSNNNNNANNNVYNKPNSEHPLQSTSFGDGSQILDIMVKHQMKQSLDKQRRRPITLDEKVQIIRDVEGGMKRSAVLQKYSLPHKSNLTGILKNRDKYLSNALNGKSGKLKRVRGFGGPKLMVNHNQNLAVDSQPLVSAPALIPPFEALVGGAGRDLAPFETNMNLLNNNAFNKLFNDSTFNERLLFGSGSGGSGDEEFQCPSEILDLTLTVGSDKQKRRSISIEDKIEIIKDIDAGMKRLDVLQKYSLADYSNLNTILKNRDKYLSNDSNIKRKRMREGKYGDVEEELTRRVDQCLMAGIAITGSLLQDIAKEVAKSLNVLDFKASNGWLNRYKKRRLLWLSTNATASASNNSRNICKINDIFI